MNFVLPFHAHRRRDPHLAYTHGSNRRRTTTDIAMVTFPCGSCGEPTAVHCPVCKELCDGDVEALGAKSFFCKKVRAALGDVGHSGESSPRRAGARTLTVALILDRESAHLAIRRPVAGRSEVSSRPLPPPIGHPTSFVPQACFKACWKNHKPQHEKMKAKQVPGSLVAPFCPYSASYPPMHWLET
jgi:hypothetical protein